MMGKLALNAQLLKNKNLSQIIFGFFHEHAWWVSECVFADKCDGSICKIKLKLTKAQRSQGRL